MKQLIIVSWIFVFSNFISFAQLEKVVYIKYPGYMVTVPQKLDDYEDSDLAPLVVGKIDSLPEKAARSRFGILFRDESKNLQNINILEITNSNTGKVIRKINLDEYYNIREDKLTFLKEVNLIDDVALPNGKKIELNFYLQSDSELKVNIKFFGKVEGMINLLDNGFTITNSEKLVQLKPTILFSIGEKYNSKVEIVRRGRQQNIVVTRSGIALEQNKKIKILSFNIVGSTISINKYVSEQINNVQKYFTNGTIKPNIVISTLSEKPRTIPGDTVLYKIIYHNIGTEPATEVNLTSPIPYGTEYLEGSAIIEFKDVEIDYEREKVEPPQIGKVLSLKWLDRGKIMPGEERWVKYRVVVR